MLIDVKMAWRNIWRNPRRTVLTILAIAFACILLVFMLSFQFGSYDTMINSSIKIQTGHLQVQAQGYNDNKTIRKVIPNPLAVTRMLDQIPQVRAYTCRTRAFVLASSEERSYGVMIVGVDPAKEGRVSTLRDIVRQGRYLTDEDVNDTMPGALIGRLLARNLKVDVGDEITVLGQGRDGSVAATVLKIQGIYASGMDAFDRSAIHISLNAFQQIFTMRKAVHEIIVIGRDLAAVPIIKASAVQGLTRLPDATQLVLLDWEALMPGLRQAINMDLVSGSIFYLILIMVVAFSILNTFLMAIFERTHEFGVMMAIGTKPARLTQLVLAESAGMTLVGITVGVFLGCLVTWFFQNYGIDFSGSSEIMRQFGIPSRIYPKLTLLSATIGPSAVFIITLTVALYPALKIRSLKPVDAMNYV